MGERLGLRDPQRQARQLLEGLDEDTLLALLQHLPQRIPGVVVGHQTTPEPTLLSAPTDPTADPRAARTFPNLSQGADPRLISDGET